MIALTQMFARPDPAATPREVIGWWERRRLYYNLIIIAWAAILICVLIAVGKERISWSAIASILVVYLLLFQLPANIFYTGGWIVDLIVKKALRLPSARFGPFALGLGIAASLLFYLGIAAYFWVAERH
jgi:hypothetical protein